MLWIESLAALLGVLSVYLMTRQRPIAWPIGLVMVLLYSWVFFVARLYSE
ncbi:MAG: nicotinamide mononucleotide transporter, partial [Gammaproteobacteria bacterium]|nr:nicotinamide mononucleotide transporter [Gammaproteobacteria bacterium]